MLSVKEFLNKHAKFEDLSSELQANTLDLLCRLNAVRGAYGKPMQVTSGYRPEAYNKKIGGSRRSAHIQCQAVDIYAPQGHGLKSWIKKNVKLMEKLGLYLSLIHI